MADVNDAGNVTRGVERQWEELNDANATDADRDAIERFINHRKANPPNGSYASSSEETELSRLRLTAERADTPLVEMGIDDVNAYLNGMPSKPSTVDAYATTLRVFFRWRDAHAAFPDAPWWEQLTTNRADRESYDADDAWRRDEIEALKDAARNNPRNRAIAAFYADSCVRLALGAQLRVGDLALDGNRPTFTPNPAGERQKGVPIQPYPLYDSVADLRVWVNNHHPEPANDDAPLWTTGYATAPVDPEDDAMHINTIAGVLRSLGERSGVTGADGDQKPANPHNFRHSKVADMRARGYSWDEIRRRTAWSESSVAAMMEVYATPSDDDLLAGIDEHEGADAADEDAADAADEDDVERRTCGNCDTTDITSEYCPSCGFPVGDEAQRADVQVPETLGFTPEFVTHLLKQSKAMMEQSEPESFEDPRIWHEATDHPEE